MIGLRIVLGVLLLLFGSYAASCLHHRKQNRAAELDGFLFSQDAPPFSTLRYGFFHTAYNGCGVAAAVNASRVLGDPVHPADVISDFERFGAILFGLFGSGTFAVTHWFRKRGYLVKTTRKRAEMDALAETAQVCILWYFHKRGAHFITLQPLENGYLAYNAGRRNAPRPIPSIEAYLKNRAFTARLIVISERD